MILYFSGTGNSRYVARKIAQELNDELISLNQLIKEEKIAEIVFMVSILIYSFAETILLDVNTNPALILVFYYAFKNWEEMKKLNNIK